MEFIENLKKVSNKNPKKYKKLSVKGENVMFILWINYVGRGNTIKYILNI